MALAHCAFSSSFPPSTPNSIRIRKTLSCLSFPSKPTKRKNHLRSKLLKTLTKPYPTTPLNPQQTPENPNETLELPQEQELDISSAQNFDEIPTLIEQEAQNDEQKEPGLQNLELSSRIHEAEGALTTRSVIELVFYIVGMFIVQTIITVWVLRSNDKDQMSDNEEEMVNGKKKEGFWFRRSVEVKPDSVIYVDESQLKEKIVEIRAMAKEVREIEAKKLSGSSSDDEDVNVSKPVVTKVNTTIQKEVDGKLSKLEKRLGPLRDNKSLKSKVSYLNNSDEVKDKKELEHSDATSVINGNSKATASQNTAYRSGTDGNDLPQGGSLGNKSEKEEQTHFSLDNSLENTASKLGRKEEEMESSTKEMGSTQEIGRKSEKKGNSLKREEGMKIENIKPRSGVVRESSDKLVKPKDSRKVKTNSSPILTKHVGYEQVVNNNGDKRTSIENDMWWLNLPYALAILLRRSSESEGPGGLYSLKMDDGSPSHIVAFEDQRDASNFCYILEAFFDELGDLISDVVPLSIKELKDEVETRAMNVIVVRKGQLQLYAGQPLADVEMTLRSLVR